MSGLDYVLERTGLWVDIWAILAILAFAIVIIYFVLRRRSLIKREEELEDLLEKKYQRESELDEDNDAETEE